MKRISLFWLGLLVAALGIAPVAATGIQESPAPSGDGLTVTGLIGEGEPIESIGRHARGFAAVRSGDLTVVSVTRPWQGAGPDDVQHYVLYPREQAPPEVDGADLVVGVPIDSIVTMSTTFLPHLMSLDAINTLRAVDSLAFVYAPEVRARGDAGAIVEVGSGPDVDVERLLAIDPDIIMVNSFGGEFDSQPTLERAGLPVVVSGDWVENTPLGRAEWLLFTALFFGAEERAINDFMTIVREYNRLRTLADRVDSRPSVLINAPFQGTWAVAGGESYAARFIRDAGGDYVWSDNESTGSLFLDIEAVFAEAGDADIWINPGTWESLDQGAAEDERFTAFKAFEQGRVYNHNRRIGPGGGNDYFESGAANPHIVLNDLIWVFHPELVPDYEPYYYQRLR